MPIRLARAGAKWDRMNQDHQHRARYLAIWHGKGLLIERVANGEGTKPKGHVCKLLLIATRRVGGLVGKYATPLIFRGDPTRVTAN